jgi:phage N-6-adenine-methyltransferase
MKGYPNSKTPAELRDRYETPAYIVNYIKAKYPKVNIDLACERDNKKFEIGLCHPERDSLKIPWHEVGTHGFCNPPYSDISPWLEKAIEESKRGFTSIFVVPSPHGSNWEELYNSARRITFIAGRVSFIDSSTGKPKGGNNRGTCIVEFSPKGLFYKRLPPHFVSRKKLEDKYGE